MINPTHQLNISVTGTSDVAQAHVHSFHPADGESHMHAIFNGSIEELFHQLYDYLIAVPVSQPASSEESQE